MQQEGEMMFFRGSRYERLPKAVYRDPSGREITYVTMRAIPPTAAVIGHRVVAGERLDHIAHQHYQDSTRYWRIGDANQATWPNDMLVEGETILIPPAED